MASASSQSILHRNPRLEFDFVDRIGCGGCGFVYKARKWRTNVHAAVKVIRIKFDNDMHDIETEIRILEKCRHVNIISYNCSYLYDERMFIFMEYAGGGSLQDICLKTGPLRETEIAFLCRETLRGIAYLHSIGIIHRDVKGANILLMETGDVKLADFGGSAPLTGKRRTLIGTPYWMAPEVAGCESNDGYDHLCDIWSLGITAIEFAEVNPPLFFLNPVYAVHVISEIGYQPPTLKMKEKWSAQFHSFISCALIINPAMRPTAEIVLQNSFLQQEQLSVQLTVDLLNKYNASTTSDFHYMEHEEAAAVNEPQCTPSRASNSNWLGKYQQLTTDQSSSPDIISRDIFIKRHESFVGAQEGISNLNMNKFRDADDM